MLLWTFVVIVLSLDHAVCFTPIFALDNTYALLYENAHINNNTDALAFLPSFVLQNVLMASTSKMASNDSEKWRPPYAESVMQGNISKECVNHTLQTLTALLDYKQNPWAVQILDAFGKPHPGSTEGNLRWVGDFDQCREVRATMPVTSPDNTIILKDLFSGQYCTASGQFNSLISGIAPVSLGMCVPDSCSEHDVEQLLKLFLSQFNVSQLLSVVCVDNSSREFDAKAIVALAICGVILSLMVVGTLFDVICYLFRQRCAEKNEYVVNGQTTSHPEKNLVPRSSDMKCSKLDICAKILVAFSVYSNGAKLMSTRQSPGSLTCINGIRFLSITWIVLGHSISLPMEISDNQRRFSTQAAKMWAFQGIANGSFSVDTFFVLSGLLVCYLTLNELRKKKGKLNWLLFYIHRFWRLTPVYMLVIMVYVCLEPYWGNGPMWPTNLRGRETCISYWWTNILYINNLVYNEFMCLDPSWYLSADMQFYVLSPLIILPLFFRPVLGFLVASILIAVTAIVPGIISMKYELQPGFFARADGGLNDLIDYQTIYYIRPWNRMGTYVIGMLAGYLLHHTQCKIRINKILNLLIWTVSTAVALTVLYALYGASSDRPLSLTLSALYNAISRQAWAVCVAWTIVACVTDNGGFVNTILSWPFFMPLSRLSYCVYLIHYIVIQLVLSNARTIFYASLINFLVFFLGILLLTNLSSVVVTLSFESPMIELEKVLLSCVKKSDQNEKKDTRTSTAVASEGSPEHLGESKKLYENDTSSAVANEG